MSGPQAANNRRHRRAVCKAAKTPAPWVQWCVADELRKTHAVNDEGDSMEYIILTHGPLAVVFHPGMKIRHRNGDTLDNRRENLLVEVVGLPRNMPPLTESMHDID
jgi:hypothetical protein